MLRRQAITLKSDVFSFGILLWELVTWLPPTFDPKALAVFDLSPHNAMTPVSATQRSASHSALPGAGPTAPAQAQGRRNSGSGSTAIAIHGPSPAAAPALHSPEEVTARTPFLMAAAADSSDLGRFALH